VKTYWSGGIVPRILHPDTRWRWVVSFAPWLLYPVGRRLGGSWSRSGRGGEKKCHHFPRRELKPGRPARSLVFVLTELRRLPHG